MTSQLPLNAIAIIGMACRFPGANHVDAFWENIKEGVESVSEFSDTELAASGVPSSLLNDPDYVKKGFVIDDPASFDAGFFGYSPREAETMDPQHRLFLETAWQAFEDAAYVPEAFPGEIGIFAGAKLSTYLINQLPRQPLTGSIEGFRTLIGNDKDYLTSRVSYKLNLRGPSICVQTACSTSLVAVHMACESLLSGACDMALAGGAAIMVPQKEGYLFQEGMILSPDGHCRPFDARAKGIAGGNGVGAVLLKPLEAAIADRDRIYAVILGSAVNNDGDGKAGYTAPSMAGQSAVIREALNISQVNPDTIDYIEAHGTGTEIGDPMEISALTRIFSEKTNRKEFCGIGSVKANIGHLDTAAGVASLIKTVMALKHRTLPPSPNFRQPNPRINFSDTPFFVSDTQKEWVRNSHPRRAGVSSFGFGGTNAHVVLEEAPDHPAKQALQYPLNLLTLSAKTQAALTRQIQNYRSFLESNPDALIEEICFTANTGRSHFPYRFAAVAASKDDLHLQLTAAVRENPSPNLFQGVAGNQTGPKVTFDMSGQSFDHDQLAGIISDSHMQQTRYHLPVTQGDKDGFHLLISALGKLYVHGADIDWNGFYHGNRLCRIQLPTYPFEKQRHWATKPVDDESHKTEINAESSQNCFYEVTWREKRFPDIEPPLTNHPGAWIVFADKSGAGHLIAEQLQARGDECVLVFSGNATADFPHTVSLFDFDKPEAYPELFSRITKRLPCRGIIHLWALDATESIDASQHLVCGSAFHMIQALHDFNWPAQTPRLCLVTQGVHPVMLQTVPLSIGQAPLWGLGKVIGIEYPELNCLRVDLDPKDAKENVPLLLNELHAIDPESQVAFRDNLRYVPRLFKPPADSTKSKTTLCQNATYLITGGLGALGLEMARWMADQKAGHIVLVSRKKPTEKVNRALDALRERIHISVLSADVTDMDELGAVFEAINNDCPPLKGIIHAAGVLKPGTSLANETYDVFLKVTAPKIQGAWNLHQLSRTQPLDFFICFSSVVSLWGIHGMASYTTGNMFLDALSHYRRSMGLKGTTINWGPWSGIGIMVDYKMDDRLAMQGIGTITVKQGIAFLEKALQEDWKQVGLLPVNWDNVIRQYLNRTELKFFDDVVGQNVLGINDAIDSSKVSDIFQQLQNSVPAEHESLLSKYLQAQISTILRIPRSQVLNDVNLMQIGMDSLIFLELAHLIERNLHITVPPRVFIEAPHIDNLVDFILTNSPVSEPDINQPESGFSISPDPNSNYVPFNLTDIQHAYWIGRSGVTELGDVACHIYFEIETEELDLDRYTAAWQMVVNRHDMLRAIILPDGRQQVLENPPLFQINAEDLRGDTPEMVSQKTVLIREEMSHQVRPADRWPLFEVRATILDDRRTLLHISMDILIADGYSIYNLLQEIDHYYRMPDQGLASIECTFRDYVLAEAAFRESDTYQRAEQYWMDKLQTLLPAPELPLAKSPSELEQTRFVRREARLDPTTWNQLQSFASQSGITRANVLLSAYAEVLATWSKSRDFTLNLTFFHRLQGHPRINEVIGDFTSLILLQVGVTHDVPFMERTRKIQEQLWKDMEFRYFSGVRVLQELSRKNQGGERTLMPVVFTSNLGYEKIRPESSGLSLPGKLVYSISQTPQVWIDNQISENEDGLVIVWDAVEDLFPDGMLDHMFDAYHKLLNQLARSGDAWRSKPVLLPEAQIQRRREVNTTEQPLSAETLNSLFTKQMERQPDHTAVITPSGRISYKDLYHQSMGIASLLADHGAIANTLVAVVMEKGWEQVVAVLGILNSGAAYLPIDPAVPRERLWHLLKDGKVKLVLTQSWLEQQLAWPKDMKLFAVDAHDYTRQDAAAVQIRQRPDDLAYVIHTSGSTGMPKGVMIDHKGAVNTILDINRRFHVSPGDHVFALSNLNFDLSVYDIFGTLAAGATIVMPDNALRKDPGHWLSLIKEAHVTVWNSVPALMQMLVEYVSGRDGLHFGTLRLVLLSGDWIPLDLPDKIRRQFDPAEIISLGGATEASIWSILYPVKTVNPDWNSIPYGRPMANQGFYVLNENMEPCPDWVPGQLYIGGSGLAKGYWRDREKTESSFIQDPKTVVPLYRTGDLGRFLPDGNIEFLGREDQQVKINGYRIELGEIESGLKQIDGISDAVVVPVADQGKNRFLAGHVITEPDYGYTDKDLKQKMEQLLPEYMVPGFYLFHDAFPVTANGKIDRKKLADPANISFQKDDIDYVNPENETEQTISDIVKEILSLEKVSTKSLFSDLGATSMHFVQMQNRLNEVCAKNVSVVNIFEYPTISSLARFISETDKDSETVNRTNKRIAIRKRLKKRNPGSMTG